MSINALRSAHYARQSYTRSYSRTPPEKSRLAALLRGEATDDEVAEALYRVQAKCGTTPLHYANAKPRFRGREHLFDPKGRPIRFADDTYAVIGHLE